MTDTSPANTPNEAIQHTWRHSNGTNRPTPHNRERSVQNGGRGTSRFSPNRAPCVEVHRNLITFSPITLYNLGMAQKIVTIYTDDLTGEESQEAQSHTLSLDGITYEIDLGPDSYEQLLEAVGPFVRAGRKVGRPRAVVKRAPADRLNGDSTKIREWAKESGYTVNGRGRVPANIREAYERAHA